MTEEELGHSLYGKTITKRPAVESRVAPTLLINDHEYELLCHNCNWNADHERWAYTSRVKVHHTKRNAAIWNIGTKWMLRDEPNDYTLANDVDALEFLNSKSTTIPIPKIIRLSDPTDTFQFTLMERAQGDVLYNVYHTYTIEQRKSLAKQLGSYVRQWRQFTAPRAQKIHGEQLHDILVGRCRGTIPDCKRIGYTNDEWIEHLSPELRQGLIMEDETLKEDTPRLEERLKELKATLPDCDTYVFTHGDLNLSNIIVKDGIITGIVDWERAGFYPSWAERVFAHMVPDEYFHEMFDYVAEDFYPGYDLPTFHEKFARPVFRLSAVYEKCPRLHRGDENYWLRRPFCKCRSYSGAIRQAHAGVEPIHEIADAYPRYDYDEEKEFEKKSWVRDVAKDP